MTSLSLKVGDRVSFDYLKDATSALVKGVFTKDYASGSQKYVGVVQDVRDISEHPLSNKTVAYGNIKGERSQRLITVEVDDDGSKAFYDGRMIGLHVEPVAA